MSRPKLLETQNLARIGVLSAPASFLAAPLSELERVCNGCGAENAKFDFVPDKIYGTYVGHACHIHDWGYEFGHTVEDKDEEDRRMRNNLLRIVDRECKKKWYKPKFLMRRRVAKYYWAVQMFGGPAFWAGKGGGAS